MGSKKITMQTIAEKWAHFLKSGHASHLLVAIGLLGMVLILASSFFPSKNSRSPVSDLSSVENGPDSEDYAKQMSQQLEEILAQMTGVGEVKVLVTLKQDAEYVYAKETKTSLDQAENHQGESGASTQSKENREEAYLIVEGSGGKQALLTTRLQPQIQGVVVVCSGGGDPTVAAEVTDAVTTALGIGSSRVCVSALG